MTSILKVSTIQDPTNSNTALTIDSAGDVTFSGPNTVTPTDSGWITATLQNGYTSYNDPYGPIKYRKIGNVVNIQGSTNQATNQLTIFTLPPGFRPDRQVIFATQNGNALARLDITKAGEVKPDFTSNTWFSCNCTFIVAQE